MQEEEKQIYIITAVRYMGEKRGLQRKMKGGGDWKYDIQHLNFENRSSELAPSAARVSVLCVCLINTQNLYLNPMRNGKITCQFVKSDLSNRQFLLCDRAKQTLHPWQLKWLLPYSVVCICSGVTVFACILFQQSWLHIVHILFPSVCFFLPSG